MVPSWVVWAEGAMVILALMGMGLLSFSETALLSVSPLRMRSLAARGHARAERICRILDQPERFLTALIAGSNLCVLVGATFATLAALRLLGPQGERWIPLVSVGMTVLFLVLGEFVPKSYAIHRSEMAALKAAPLIEGAARVLGPLATLFSWIAIRSLRLLGFSLEEASTPMTPARLRFLIQVGEEQGILEEMERDIFDNILEFTETTVREIMCPRTDMVCAPKMATLQEVVRIMEESGYSRIPVYEETLDTIVGVAYVRDVLAELRRGSPERTLGEVPLRQPYFVPETKRISELLKEFRQQHTHMAIVVDEYGGTAGLVTLEDVLEEVVGEIQDEFDREQPLLQALPDGSYLVDPRIEAEKFQEAVGVDLPLGDYTSLGGFLLMQAGRIPSPGQVLACGCRHSRLEFEVLEVRRHRLAKVRVRVYRLDEGEGERLRVQVREDGSIKAHLSTPLEVVGRLLGVELPPEAQGLNVEELLRRLSKGSPEPEPFFSWQGLLLQPEREEEFFIVRREGEAGPSEGRIGTRPASIDP